MKFTSRDYVLVTGKAFTGKTYFIKRHLREIPAKRPVLIYDFNHEYTEESKKKDTGVWLVRRGTITEMEEFTQMAYDAGNCQVVFSECDNYIRSKSPVLLAIVTTGRNRGIGCWMDAKRPMAVPPEWRSRFNKLVLFQTTLPDDIEYLEKWTGTGRGSLQFLTGLKQGEHIVVDTDAQTISPVKKL